MKSKIISMMLLSILAISLVVAVNADYCCEKTDYGAWCQNAPEEKCDNSYRMAPTSCDATSYCKLGCCYDSTEGLCMENTPQRVCDDVSGTWSESKECEIEQCQLGCCVLDTEAAFVTLTRCKKLSGFYGIETDFQLGIGSEMECIAQTQLKYKGACVYETEEFVRTCKFTTKEDCNALGESGGEFYKDYLCSADELATECGPSTETRCVDGKEEVYFTDTCGNPANIYDASRYNDPEYWTKVLDKSESCGYGNNNADSKECGNCDYFLGSLCRNSDSITPRYGENICADLNCYDASDGNDHRHGESWCSYDGNTGLGADSVGSVHVRHICVAGEELTENCADGRQKVCLETETDTGSGIFTEAACIVNRWQEGSTGGCLSQDEQDDCENTDKRDCYWIEGVSFLRGAEGNTGESGGIANLVYGVGGVCVPNVPPSLNFWDEGDAEGICSVANSECVVVYEKGLFDSKKCVDNCECLKDGWAEKMNEVCISVGDCGAYVNWVGDYEDDGYDWKISSSDRSLSKGIIDSLRKQAGV